MSVPRTRERASKGIWPAYLKGSAQCRSSVEQEHLRVIHRTQTVKERWQEERGPEIVEDAPSERTTDCGHDPSKISNSEPPKDLSNG